MFARFRTIFFFKFSETVKIWLCVMDWFIEKLVLKFGRNRSRNNEVMTILNIWWKNGEFYFWPPEPQIFGFFLFSKMDLVVHDEGNRMAFTPSKSALRFWDLKGGGIAPPPHQLTSSRKPTSNRVKLHTRNACVPLGPRSLWLEGCSAAFSARALKGNIWVDAEQPQ